MTDSKTDKPSSWKNWIIKKLLSSESTKEEILNFIASGTEEKKHLPDWEENNEKNLIKTYSLRVDDELIKQAHYNLKTKKATIEDLGLSYFSKTEKDLKAMYFKKWKDEDEAKEQDFRNERYMERLRVNGGI